MTFDKFMQDLDWFCEQKIQMDMLSVFIFLLIYAIAVVLTTKRKRKPCVKCPEVTDYLVAYTLHSTGAKPHYIKQLLVQVYAGPPILIPQLHSYVVIGEVEYFVRAICYVIEEHRVEVQLEEKK